MVKERVLKFSNNVYSNLKFVKELSGVFRFRKEVNQKFRFTMVLITTLTFVKDTE